MSQSMGRRLAAFTSAVEHLLWPVACVHCGMSIRSRLDMLCDSCWMGLRQACRESYCPSCGCEVSRYGIVQGRCAHCQNLELATDGIARAGAYEGILRQLILRFKFQDGTEFVPLLASCLEAAMVGRVFSEPLDVLVPVPLHWRRRLLRGFNQASLLSRKLSLDVPIDTCLIRKRYTQSQWRLSPAKRRRNVAGAFRLRRKSHVEGKCICLVDDITTTGATLHECARVLKEAGARCVYAAVLAVAGTRSDAPG